MKDIIGFGYPDDEMGQLAVVGDEPDGDNQVFISWAKQGEDGLRDLLYICKVFSQLDNQAVLACRPSTVGQVRRVCERLKDHHCGVPGSLVFRREGDVVTLIQGLQNGDDLESLLDSLRR